MGFYGQRYRWHELEFRCDMDRPQLLEQPCLRFSVALPLGINRKVSARAIRVETARFECRAAPPRASATRETMDDWEEW